MRWREETIGDCRLILGDCREFLPTLENESIDMIFMDPPYGHGNADGDLLALVNKGVFPGRPATPGGGAVPIVNDHMDDMREVVGFALTEAARILRRESCCCCCCCGGGGPRPTFAWLANRMDDGGLQFFHSVIWDKVNPGLGWRYKRQHEMVLVAHRRGGRLAWADSAQPIGNIFRGFFPGSERDHPNEKPLWLVQGFVARHTNADSVVLDPFMGCGTTGVAAVNYRRRFIGVEIEQQYFDIACKRIEEAYQQPRLFNDEPAAPQFVQGELFGEDANGGNPCQSN